MNIPSLAGNVFEVVSGPTLGAVDVQSAPLLGGAPAQLMGFVSDNKKWIIGAAVVLVLGYFAKKKRWF